MSLPIEELTPRQIVAQLDRYIVGQEAAKRAIAVALRNRYRRQQLPEDERDDILPKNILMMGPTGVGKTEIARRLAQLARAPFIKVEATKFTEVGYVGRDVESMVRDLAAAAVRLVERERMEAVRDDAEKRAMDRIVNLIEESTQSRRPRTAIPESLFLHPDSFGVEPVDDTDYEADAKRREANELRRRRRILKGLKAGEYDENLVVIETEESQNPFMQVFTPQGIEEMSLDTGNAISPFPSRRRHRTMTVKEARTFLVDEEARSMLDTSSMQREAIQRAEQTGIIFLDELDKVAGKSGGSGPDVSREGVQRDLLPIIEGSTVATKFGPVRTDHVLFIAAGAFHMSKPSDLIPELQGRLPIRVTLETLSETDFRRILTEPKNALSRQYERLLSTEGVHVQFTEAALNEIAHFAAEVNAKTENIGARRLHTVMEKLLQDLLFDAPEACEREITIDAVDVRARLGDLVKDDELSRYIL